MEELFEEFDKLNINHNFTLTIMYTKYLEWSITIIDEGNGWEDIRIVSDVYDGNKENAVKKAIEKIKNYKRCV